MYRVFSTESTNPRMTQEMVEDILEEVIHSLNLLNFPEYYSQWMLMFNQC